MKKMSKKDQKLIREKVRREIAEWNESDGKAEFVHEESIRITRNSIIYKNLKGR